MMTVAELWEAIQGWDDGHLGDREIRVMDELGRTFAVEDVELLGAEDDGYIHIVFSHKNEIEPEE